MKKLLMILLAAVLFCGAAPQDADDAEALPREAADPFLTILNTDRFDGMSQTYNEGYLPELQEGSVHVILPLASRVPLARESLSVRLAAPDSAPFVLPTYDRTVTEAIHAACSESGEEAEIRCYLVSFELPLAEGATPGRWPLTLIASGAAEDGPGFAESFTIYVTVPELGPVEADDLPPDAPDDAGADMTGVGGEGSSTSSGSSTQSTPAPVPRLLLASMQTSPYPVSAGADFSVEAVLQNVSPSQAVTNVVATLVPAGESLAPQPGQPLAFHFERIPNRGTVSFTALLHADAAADPGNQRLILKLAYEGHENQQYAAEEEILVPLTQPVRLEWDAPDVPQTLRAGDTLNLAFQAMNLGRAPLYNVRVTLHGQGLQPETSLFLGNLESGQAAQGEMYVFVGIPRLDEPENQYGSVAGSMTLCAENAEGSVTTLTKSFETDIEAPLIEPASAVAEGEMAQDDTSFQWILAAVIAAAVIAVLAAVQITRWKTAARCAQKLD